MSTALDPRDVLDKATMSTLQIVVVALTVMLNALDGFDVLAISFASNGISSEFNTSQTELGFVLMMELLGMAIGSIFLGGVADKIGRRTTILGCLFVMAVGMFMTTTVSSVSMLMVWRVFTGIGIGGVLAATNAVTAEFASAKRKHLCISLMAIGYPLGGVFGGMIVSGFEWRSVFYFGSAVTAIMIPTVYFLIPESVHWLARKQPEGALEKINKTMQKMGHAVVSALPEIKKEDVKRSVTEIFAPGLIAITVIITLAYFMHVTTFYFILKWTPKIITLQFELPGSLANGVLVWANIGGAIGGAIFGLLTMKFDLKKLSILILVGSAVFVAVFGQTPADTEKMKIYAAMAGFFGNAGIVGLYALIAHAFPTHLRATGTGFVIGMGRAGAMISPPLAGFLFDSGATLPVVAMVMGSGSLVAAVALIFLKLNKDQSASGSTVSDNEDEDLEAAAIA